MVQVTWVPRAQRDLKEIWDYIALDSERYAEAVVLRLTGATRILHEQPLLGKPVPEIGLPEFRELVVAGFRIIYWISSKGRIHVLAVVRSKRRVTARMVAARIPRRLAD